MTDEKEQRGFLEMTELAANYRGRFIEKFILLETTMEAVISTHLSNGTEKMNEIFSFLGMNESFPFSVKLNILNTIIKGFYPFFLEKNHDYLTLMDKCMPLRNKLAHRRALINPETISNFDGETIILYWLTTSKGKLKEDQLILNKETFGEIMSNLEKLFLMTRALQHIVETLCEKQKGGG